MKIKENKSNLFFSGEIGEGVEQKVNVQNSNLITSILRDKIYTDKLRAALIEPLSNAVDEHRKYGIGRPVEVYIENNIIHIRDFAKGLSEEDVYKVFFTYLNSTKNDSDEAIGGFGLGAKAPSAYTDTWYVTSFHDGTKTVYMSSVEGSKGYTRKLQQVACDPNDTGIMVSIPICEDDMQKAITKLMEGRDSIGCFEDIYSIVIYNLSFDKTKYKYSLDEFIKLPNEIKSREALYPNLLKESNIHNFLVSVVGLRTIFSCFNRCSADGFNGIYLPDKDNEYINEKKSVLITEEGKFSVCMANINYIHTHDLCYPIVKTSCCVTDGDSCYGIPFEVSDILRGKGYTVFLSSDTVKFIFRIPKSKFSIAPNRESLSLSKNESIELANLIIRKINLVVKYYIDAFIFTFKSLLKKNSYNIYKVLYVLWNDGYDCYVPVTSNKISYLIDFLNNHYKIDVNNKEEIAKLNFYKQYLTALTHEVYSQSSWTSYFSKSFAFITHIIGKGNLLTGGYTGLKPVAFQGFHGIFNKYRMDFSINNSYLKDSSTRLKLDQEYFDNMFHKNIVDCETAERKIATWLGYKIYHNKNDVNITNAMEIFFNDLVKNRQLLWTSNMDRENLKIALIVVKDKNLYSRIISEKDNRLHPWLFSAYVSYKRNTKRLKELLSFSCIDEGAYKGRYTNFFHEICISSGFVAFMCEDDYKNLVSNLLLYFGKDFVKKLNIKNPVFYAEDILSELESVDKKSYKRLLNLLPHINKNTQSTKLSASLFNRMVNEDLMDCYSLQDTSRTTKTKSNRDIVDCIISIYTKADKKDDFYLEKVESSNLHKLVNGTTNTALDKSKKILILPPCKDFSSVRTMGMRNKIITSKNIYNNVAIDELYYGDTICYLKYILLEYDIYDAIVIVNTSNKYYTSNIYKLISSKWDTLESLTQSKVDKYLLEFFKECKLSLIDSIMSTALDPGAGLFKQYILQHKNITNKEKFFDKFLCTKYIGALSKKAAGIYVTRVNKYRADFEKIIISNESFRNATIIAYNLGVRSIYIPQESENSCALGIDISSYNGLYSFKYSKKEGDIVYIQNIFKQFKLDKIFLECLCKIDKFLKDTENIKLY